MKILLLNATPHKGNTWRVMCALRDEIAQADPAVEFEEIHLAGLGLPFCTGCSLCFRQGHRFCPHADILLPLLAKMEAGDGLIFGTTTFNMAPNALAKNLMDHWCFLLHRPHFFRNKAMVVSTTGGVGAGKTVDYTAGTLRAIGYNRCYKLPLASASWNDYRPSPAAQRKIRHMALCFYKDCVSGCLAPASVLQMIPYNLFRGMSLAYAKGSPYETEDGNHWSDPVRAHMAYDPSVPMPFYKKPLGHLFYLIGRAAGNAVTVTYKK
ncbi:flavodoxin family protein [Ethanoligenens harbinense]|uniref:NADPH-dependent FMN reductase n=1 Tax=Ethanoligenens harbinense (strain DSM 18485 / JCM 12961 / CGMCC 1.5033 / YUAN-3) TaxID=663278 RepID=E6U487_ETHHY|nr:NAD(P)H-dependent oxidoreductase [Ethanoligenens harbinense]ADU26587.1 NADPH-dependent FMN reductase [Ethanoligenens harbinense YUAN-3]AVQ95712.1 NADPH-dependent oxidoreductase [Ethanoligenens harbinense YUAN-3]AYF38375.1 NADPH-dependent oxidoreductase [Ethanoligenens harbinense]AYF41119.1 NADPH-dependent oxidoreductase [Ethanoligenens harbinense]QCN91951.1 NADPH-dependent oxidoreductase [Ethanoligenens harbinense]